MAQLRAWKRHSSIGDASLHWLSLLHWYWFSPASFLPREIPSQVKLTEATLWRHHCFVRWYSQVDPEENQVNFVVCLARKQEIWRFSGGYYRSCASAQNGHLLIARSPRSKFYFCSVNFFTITYFHFHLSLLGPVHTYMFTFVNAYFLCVQASRPHVNDETSVEGASFQWTFS